MAPRRDNPTVTEQELAELKREVAELRADRGKEWEAIAALNSGVSVIKPIPLSRYPGLREILEAHAARSGGQEQRPYTMPEHTQIVGGVR